MHNGYMHDGWGGGSWEWIVMVALMVLFWGGIIWVSITLIRRTGRPTSQVGAAETGSAPPTVWPNPQDVLADRLARGDIDPDDYRQRLDALRQARSA